MTSPSTAVRGGVTEARAAAAEICADLRAGELLDPSFERRVGVLDARDRRWVQELVWGMLRRRAWVDAVLATRVRGGLARLDPDLTDLLRLGLYQLCCMRSVPAYAAIAQTVELAKRRHGIGASKLVNAVLRRADRERDELDPAMPADAIDALALRYSHPRWLVARWVARWGGEDTERLLAANNVEAPIIVRPYGIVREQLEATLESAGVHPSDAPLARDSLLLPSGVALTELGAYRQGLFFVQDPASTLVDVPCTGTGTFRRHPDARWRLKVSDLAVMSALQRAIVRAAATVVKPGGLLVYSTCSLEPEENEAQVESFLAEHGEFRLEPPAAGVVPDEALDAGRLRVLPQRHGADGAFAARLRRVA